MSPTPFLQLIELLYSDKKPGDLPPRQSIVEIVTSLFDVFPPGEDQKIRPVTSSEWTRPVDAGSSIHLPPTVDRAESSERSAHALVKSLIIGPPDEREEAKVDFIRQAHKSRRYKKFINEVSWHNPLSDLLTLRTR